ncbi:MAG: hypothetical protein FH747_03065 [Stenotrophomonas sp.]|uniref:hypothetical protein n=1 Tax=Stenotrophomonas sp. TaxID=69392 RepID=UPI001353B662|nr:hypothetical protein [Stenotrophomonas sp.]MTI72568.1 hypothetical protein [Stenotrophomonas sp.]MTI72628.1 hypothetical protein [Stenotrophomonas sp.]|tara:strand:- start:27317 stop:27787 length:471 start_codon:yes stop_codon:yes gene_type:complete
MAKQKRTVLLRVTDDGAFVPADDLSKQLLRQRKIRRGDLVSADPKKARNPTAWKRAHKLAQLLIENLDDFTNMDAHSVLKRLQFEADIGCERMDVKVPGYGVVSQRWPKSMSFDQMDEGEFQQVYGQFCQHIIDMYWNGLTQDQIEQMSNLLGVAA